MRISIARLALISCLFAALGFSAQAQETQVIQNLSLSTAANEILIHPDSPFIYPASSDEWRLDTKVAANYGLRFRAKDITAQAQIYAEASNAGNFAFELYTAWVKFNMGEGWGMAFGRRELKWKDGGYWNPSDVVNARLAWGQSGQASGRDSLELFGLLPFTDFNIDVNLATAFSKETTDIEKLPLYLSLGTILYPFEFKLKGAFRLSESPVFGAGAKVSLEALDLYSDLAWIRAHPLVEGLAARPAEGNWLRWCAGLTYSMGFGDTRIADTVSFRGEYLRQDDGLDAAEGSAFFGNLSSDRGSSSTLPAYSAAANQFGARFFSLFRDYCLASLTVSNIGKVHLSWTESCLLNLDDLGLALTSSLSWEARGICTISLSARNYLGKMGSEALMVPETSRYSLSFSKSF